MWKVSNKKVAAPSNGLYTSFRTTICCLSVEIFGIIYILQKNPSGDQPYHTFVSEYHIKSWNIVKLMKIHGNLWKLVGTHGKVILRELNNT